MSSYDELGPDAASSYGTDANFQANYRLTAAFINAHKGPFLTENRIWIGGSREFPVDMANYAKLLTKEGIIYSREAPGFMPTWDSGWVPYALAALRQDSIKFRPDDSNPPPAGQVPAAPMSPRVIALRCPGGSGGDRRARLAPLAETDPLQAASSTAEAALEAC